MVTAEVLREIILAARGAMDDYSIPLDAEMTIAGDQLVLSADGATWTPDRRQLVLILRALPPEMLEALRPIFTQNIVAVAEVRDTVSIELNGKPI